MPIKRLSMIIPMRNEAERVDALMEQIAAQDWDGELEILIGDGRSEDDSVARVRAAGRRLDLGVTIVDNPLRVTAHALNACIAGATGDLIVRMDCHARFDTDYLRACVRASEETGADNVGGPTLVEGESTGERATACAMESPFGGIGWTRRAPTGPVEHDTVYCGAFLPSVFERVGLFKAFGANEDDELNMRLRAAGGRIVLDPRIRIWYTPRAALGAVFRQYFRYGFWKPHVMMTHRRVFSLRSLVPGGFVVTLTTLAALAPFTPTAAALLVGVVALYAAAAAAFGTIAIRRRAESARLLPRVMATFPMFHLGFGIGSLAGAVDMARRCFQRTCLTTIEAPHVLEETDPPSRG